MIETPVYTAPNTRLHNTRGNTNGLGINSDVTYEAGSHFCQTHRGQQYLFVQSFRRLNIQPARLSGSIALKNEIKVLVG